MSDRSNQADNLTADNARKNVLKTIEKNEKNYKLAFLGAAVIECLFLAGFLLLADLHNRLHLLLLLSAMTIYTIVGIGLIALGTHVSWNTQRIIRAIESLDDRR